VLGGVCGPLLAVGHASERRSRYADKPALFIGNREIAHSEAPGVIDLRITRGRLVAGPGKNSVRTRRCSAIQPAVTGSMGASTAGGGRRTGASR